MAYQVQEKGLQCLFPRLDVGQVIISQQPIITNFIQDFISKYIISCRPLSFLRFLNMSLFHQLEVRFMPDKHSMDPSTISA